MSFISTYLVIVFYIALLYLGHYKGPLGYFCIWKLSVLISPHPTPKRANKTRKSWIRSRFIIFLLKTMPRVFIIKCSCSFCKFCQCLYSELWKYSLSNRIRFIFFKKSGKRKRKKKKLWFMNPIRNFLSWLFCDQRLIEFYCPLTIMVKFPFHWFFKEWNVNFINKKCI